jgi:hypothetical protein
VNDSAKGLRSIQGGGMAQVLLETRPVGILVEQHPDLALYAGDYPQVASSPGNG